MDNKYRVTEEDKERNNAIKKKFIIDATGEEIEGAKKSINDYIHNLAPDNSERELILKKRRNFFEGKHHLYSNVVGLRSKEVQGRILAVFNYVGRMSRRLIQALTNSPVRFKMVPLDEADEIESIRAENEENWIGKVFKDNHFFDIIFKRNATIQVRDADFAIKVIVEEDEREGKKIKIYWAENIEKLYVIWDDAAGTGFSGVCYKDEWTLDKIAREFDGYKASAIADNTNATAEGSQGDEFGVNFQSSISSQKTTASGKNKIPKGSIKDYWGWFRVNDNGSPVWKMCNVIMINDDVVQFVKTDYVNNPWIIGHSFDNPGSPYSIGFIDDLIDPQVELNDRQSDEGDMIRVGSHQKFVVVNMPKFNAKSVKPGSGQVIFVEGENADFRPLETNVNSFPTEQYLNRNLEHLFTLGIPKIALSAGTAPYTGRIGVIQYQVVSDLVDELRIKWTPVLYELIKRIQRYSNQFFPETKGFMTGHSEDSGDLGLVERDCEFEWDSVLPQSRSEGIVDASTLFDRTAIPMTTYLEMAGFKDPQRIIKQLKKEFNDPDMVAIRKFAALSKGAVEAQSDATQRQQADQQEAVAEQASMVAGIQENQGSQPSQAPILQKFQNSGTRGIPSGAGTPGVGATSTSGAAAQVSQNLRAKGQ